MNRCAFLVALAALLAAAGAAQAQEVPGTITVAAEDPGMVPWNGTAELEVSATVECTRILGAMGSTTVAVTVSSPNQSITAADGSIELAPADCVSGAGTAQGNTTLTLVPAQDAPGIVPIPLTVTAELGGENGTANVTTSVSYRPGHTITPSISFPYTVENGTVTFDLVVEFTGNAPTMVMFEDQRLSAGGSVRGLAPKIRDPPATETLEVTFDAPTGRWNSTTFAFTNFSHYILTDSGQAGEPVLVENVTWTFVQGGDGGPTGTGDGDGEDSPGAGVLLLGAAVLVAVAVARRRA